MLVLSVGGVELEYRLADLREGEDPEAWARALADEGWRIWPEGSRSGALVRVNGELVRRYSLARLPEATGE